MTHYGITNNNGEWLCQEESKFIFWTTSKRVADEQLRILKKSWAMPELRVAEFEEDTYDWSWEGNKSTGAFPVQSSGASTYNGPPITSIT